MQYRRRDSLIRLYDLKERFADRVIKEMEKSGRYPEDSFLRPGRGILLIEEEAFRDYLRWRTQKGIVPEYKRAETPEDTYLIGVETR